MCALALFAGPPLHAQSPKAFDAAAAFGSRPDITSLRLSPDGLSVAFVTPIEGQGSVVYTVGLTPGAKPKVAFLRTANPSGSVAATGSRMIAWFARSMA